MFHVWRFLSLVVPPTLHLWEWSGETSVNQDVSWSPAKQTRKIDCAASDSALILLVMLARSGAESVVHVKIQDTSIIDL